MKPQYLFICGAPRSGTTLLARLLGANAAVVMGIERFKGPLARGTFTPELFEPERFFSFEETDTNVKGPAYELHYAQSRAKFPAATYVGDKIPNLYKKMEAVGRKFGPDAQFIFCFRNVVDVAASWNARARKASQGPGGNWPETNDFRVGAKAWNDSLRFAVSAKLAGIKVLPFAYDTFAVADAQVARESYEALLHKLGLSLTPSDAQALAEETERFKTVLEQRTALTESEVTEVLQSVDLQQLHRFMKQFHLPPATLPRDLRQLLKAHRAAPAGPAPG